MKIGIRPTVDRHMYGHDQNTINMTIRMAKKTAELIEQNVFSADGKAIKCILPEGTIGCAAQAEECANYFSANSIIATITVTPTWCHSTEVMDLGSLPQAIWGLNGTDLPGGVFLGAALSTYAQKGIPVFAIYGKDVQDSPDEEVPKDVAEKIIRFAKCAAVLGQIKGKSYLSIGSMSLGMSSSVPNPDFFENYLGMRCEYCDMTEIVRRAEHKVYDEDELEKAYAWVKKNCKEGEDKNEEPFSKEKKDEDWRYVIKMAMIVRDLMNGNENLKGKGYLEEAIGRNAIAASFQGSREWTDFLPNADFMESVLNSSFDWNGKRSPNIVATENDSFNAATMLLSKLITNSAQIFTDVRTYWSPDAVKRVTGKSLPDQFKNGFIHLTNSGPMCIDAAGMQKKDSQPTMKPFWEIDDKEMQECLDAVTWYPAGHGSFPGGGFSSRIVAKGGMLVTLSRINYVKGIGPVLQIAEGITVDLPKDIAKIIDDRTDPTCPMAWFLPRITGEDVFKDIYSVMAMWGSNHGTLSSGHIGAELITLASMLRIPVYMHNIEEKEIFRPHVWNSFGTKSKEQADFAACKAYRSLY